MVVGLMLILAACPKHPTTPENIAIQAINDAHPQDLGGAGGRLRITGSGFTSGNPVSVGILNAPGASSPWSQDAGNADASGNINVIVSYSYPTSGPSSILPGCGRGSTSSTSLNVTAADKTTHAFGATTADVLNCGWVNLQVSQHQ